jgi:SagB-type dehydrogenase family enzyme
VWSCGALAANQAGTGGDHVVCGQTYFGDAHDLLVLTARFDRAFWKYRNHRKAFTALLMDAAHMSQTLYLVATDLGLGGLRHRRGHKVDIEERFGIDGYREGVLAVCGSGGPPPNAHPSS